MERLILTGNEAVALAATAVDTFASFAFPGAPATDIHRAFRLLHQKNITTTAAKSPWSTNEKTAYETALGLSYAGRRALVSFNHVGLNVAMDPFMSSAVTGINGGMLLAVVDDPSMHLGHSGQDSRIPAAFAQLPCLEPWDQQAAFDWTKIAYQLSEKLALPIVLRLVYRLAHSRAGVCVNQTTTANDPPPAVSPTVTKSWRSWSLQAGHARNNFENLIQKQTEINAALEAGPFFDFNEEGDKSLGIIACGIARNYVLEAFERYQIKHPLLSVGAYRVPDTLLRKMFEYCSRILIVEDGMPVLERRLHAAVIANKETILGRLTGDLPAFGELKPSLVAKALGINVGKPVVQFEEQNQRPLATRPPTHKNTCAYLEVTEAIQQFFVESGEGRVFGDVGAFSQAEAPAYEARETCVDAGASIPMATGASLAGVKPALALIGDITFLHTGMAGLKDAVNLKADITVIISDNRPVDITATSTLIPSAKQVTQIVRGLGVSKDQIHLFHTDANNFDRRELQKTLAAETEKSGPSVIICISGQKATPQSNAENAAEPVLAESLNMLHYRFAPADNLEQAKHSAPAERPVRFDLVIAGVGGQAALALAQSVSIAAAQSGRHVKQAETRSRSAEGESILSHLRFADTPIHSDLVQLGSADLLLATEPLEAIRWLEFLRPEEGLLVANVRPVMNIPAYPYREEILQKIRRVPNHILLDSVHLANAAGAPAAAHLVTLGAAADSMAFNDATWGRCLQALTASTTASPVNLDIAQKAFALGRNAGRFYRALINAEVDLHDALIVASHVELPTSANHPSTLKTLAQAWQQKLADTTNREILLTLAETTTLQSVMP